jgi:hypothetical protein
VAGYPEKSTRLGIDAQRIETSTEAAKLAESLARVTTKRTRLFDLYLEGRVERVIPSMLGSYPSSPKRRRSRRRYYS